MLGHHPSGHARSSKLFGLVLMTVEQSFDFVRTDETIDSSPLRLANRQLRIRHGGLCKRRFHQAFDCKLPHPAGLELITHQADHKVSALRPLILRALHSKFPHSNDSNRWRPQLCDEPIRSLLRYGVDGECRILQKNRSSECPLELQDLIKLVPHLLLRPDC